MERVIRWAGLRQDSGDPFTFAPRVIAMYESVGVDFRQKQIVFSDSLDIDKCIQLHKQCEELGLRKGLDKLASFPFALDSFISSASFGIGTFLTNDFRTLSSDRKEKSKALNIVIKLASVDGKPCIKLSDDLSKVSECFLSKASREFIAASDYWGSGDRRENQKDSRPCR